MLNISKENYFIIVGKREIKQPFGLCIELKYYKIKNWMFKCIKKGKKKHAELIKIA